MSINLQNQEVESRNVTVSFSYLSLSLLISPFIQLLPVKCSIYCKLRQYVPKLIFFLLDVEVKQKTICYHHYRQ